MKKHLFFTVVLTVGFAMLTGSFVLLAQVPQSFKYQAVARDAAGAMMANQELNFEISILKGDPSGEVVFAEQHTDTTNQFGLVTLDIGRGNVFTGDFSSIAWGDDTYFLMVEMEGIYVGIMQLLSVPYALHAQTVSVDNVDDADADPLNEIQSLSLSGNDLSLSKGGGSVTLPASAGGGDNWGSQTVVADETLTGLGIETNPLGIVDGGVTSAKILDGSILTHDLADFNVTVDKLANHSVTTEKINTGAVTGIKIAQAGATSGQALLWNGSNWIPGNVSTGMTTYKVGDFAQGGIVFWVDESDQHGLVCAKEDQDDGSGIRWYAGTYGNTHAYGNGPFSGEMNTAIIIAAYLAIGDDEDIYAARLCADMKITKGGKTYGDWYLPSKEELRLMYENKSTIDNTALENGGSTFASTIYWSSTQDGFGGAWGQSFNNGAQVSYESGWTLKVRAIRAF
ncbi:MAG: DUF1566 domain-containing protein [Bacteroidales bacterium]